MRANYSVARHKSLKRIRKKAKGYRGGRSKLLRVAKETIVRAENFATRDRKKKKRDFRRLWITRINGALFAHGINYSSFMNGLKKAEVSMNRKMLSELAIHNAEAFGELVELAKSKLQKAGA